MEKSNKKPAIKDWIKDNGIFLTGVLIVIVFYLVEFITKKQYPFGDHMLVGGDSIHSLIPLYEELKRKLLSGEPLWYTWGGYEGTNLYYQIIFSVMSPLTWIPLLFPVKGTLAVYNIMAVVKAVLLYLTTFYYFTHRISKARLSKHDIEVLLFSLAYVFCNAFLSCTVFYPFSDSMIILPLLILGLERFVSNRGWRLYFISLILMIFTNFYLGVMSCLFVILYYLTCKFKSFKEFIIKSLKIMALSLAAIGVSGIIICPLMYIVMGGGYGVSEYNGFGFFTNWFNIIRQCLFITSPVYAGTNYATYWEANLYFGMFGYILAFTYFLNKRVRPSVRLKKLAVFLLFALSFNESTLNYIMHMFHYTNGLPNRHAFMFVFFCLILAQESFYYIKCDIKNVGIVKTVIIAALVLVGIIGSLLYVDKVNTVTPFLYSLDLAILYIGILLLQKKFKSRKTFMLTFVVIGIAEIVASAHAIIQVRSEFNTDEYYNKYKSVKQAAEEIAANDKSFYHIKTNNMDDDLNYGMLAGYNGIEMYGNSANRNYITSMEKLGVVGGPNTIRNYSSNPFLNSILNVKYIITNRDGYSEGINEEKYNYEEPLNQYEEISDKDNFTVHKNEKVLSPVIVAEGDMEEYLSCQKYEENIYERYNTLGDANNALLKGLCKEDNLFKETDIKIKSIDTENCRAYVTKNHMIVADANGGSNKDTSVEYNSNFNSVITVHCTAKEAGDLYVRVVKPQHIGMVKAGEEFSFSFELESNVFNEFGLFVIDYNSWIYDSEKWDAAYEKLKGQQLDIKKYGSNFLKGTLTSTKDNMVFTTIPYDDNWNIYVDGKKVKAEEFADSSLSFDVTKGEHEIFMEYKQKGFVAGLLISLIFLALGIAMCVYYKKGKSCFWLEKGVVTEDYEPPVNQKAIFKRKIMHREKREEDKEAEEEKTEAETEK